MMGISQSTTTLIQSFPDTRAKRKSKTKNYVLSDLKKLANGSQDELKLPSEYVYLGNKGAKVAARIMKRNFSLRKVDISGSAVGNSGAKAIGRAISKNKTIVSLNVSNNCINDRGISHIARALKTNNTICELSLHDNQIGKKGLQHILQALAIHDSIEIISLSNLDSFCFELLGNFLQESKNLKTIAIYNTDFCQKEPQDIFKSLRKSKSLQVLKLKACVLPFGDFVTSYLIRSRLQELHIAGMEIQHRMIAGIGNAIQSSKTLEVLSIDASNLQNQIRSEHMVPICDALFHNQNIKELAMPNNSIGSEGVENLVKFLKRCNSRLEKLDLSNNKINCKGAEALCEGLKHSKANIIHLNLSNNRIGQGGLVAFAKLLRQNPKLQKLQLTGLFSRVDYGALSMSLASKIGNAMMWNSNLKEFHLFPSYCAHSRVFHFKMTIVRGAIQNNSSPVMSRARIILGDDKYLSTNVLSVLALWKVAIEEGRALVDPGRLIFKVPPKEARLWMKNLEL